MSSGPNHDHAADNFNRALAGSARQLKPSEKPGDIAASRYRAQDVEPGPVPAIKKVGS